MTRSTTAKAEPRHPFGELLAQYRARKPGLTQTRLAELSGYDQAILVRMAQGKKDLTGPSGRERVVRLIETLTDQGALTMLDEANALLLAADMPPLFEPHPEEARLITRLSRLPLGQRVRRTNLPAPLTSFIGRGQEIAEVRRLLGLTRLLTLTGSGGRGKTRLAQRIAADVLLLYSEGVWYAELAALSDSALIPDVVARALGLVASDWLVQEQVMDYLRERQVLLVLDNCVHLIEAIAVFSIEVLQACPRVTILTTSREALNVDGETTWRVPPMQPDEAGHLFVDRAAAARSDTNLSAQDETVSQICQRLDGMPLAIELAAARLGTLSLSDIASRLEDRFALLVGGRRGALPRHQTLRALIDWSYDSLSEPEKIVFRRVSVFIGGWALEQAEQVVSDDILDRSKVLPLLTQLASKSLVVIDAHEEETRYRLLETIREYALDKLEATEELNARHRWHAESFLNLAERSAKPLHTADQRMSLAYLERDYANLRAAMEWSFSPNGDAFIGCKLIGALYHFWYVASGHQLEARQWIKLARNVVSDDMPPAVQAWVWMAEEWFASDVFGSLQRSERVLKLFEVAGDRINVAMTKSVVSRALYYVNHDYLGTLQLSETAVLEARELGDNWTLRFNLVMLGECLRFGQQDTQRAEAVYREAMVLSRAAGDLDEVARILIYYISGFAQERLDFAEAIRCAQEGLDLARSVGDPLTELQARCAIAENVRYQGDVSHAIALLEECMAFARERLTEYETIQPLICLSRAKNMLGDYTSAHALLNKALRLRQALPMPFGAYGIFDVMAVVAAAQGQAVHAAHLRGMADNMIAMNNHYRKANYAWEYAPYITKARAALGDAAYEAAYAEGRAMTLEQAIAYALNDKMPDPSQVSGI